MGVSAVTGTFDCCHNYGQAGRHRLPLQQIALHTGTQQCTEVLLFRCFHRPSALRCVGAATLAARSPSGPGLNPIANHRSQGQPAAAQATKTPRSLAQPAPRHRDSTHLPRPMSSARMPPRMGAGCASHALLVRVFRYNTRPPAHNVTFALHALIYAQTLRLMHAGIGCRGGGAAGDR